MNGHTSLGQILWGQKALVTGANSGIGAAVAKALAEAEADLLKLIPYGRVGNVEDVAHAAVWLSSDLSDYVTGATLYIDGGMTLYPGFHEGG